MLYPAYKYKKPKKIKLGKDEILDIFDVFKREAAANNGTRIKNALSAPTKRKAKPLLLLEDIDAHIAGMKKGKVRKYLSHLVRNGGITRRQKNALLRSHKLGGTSARSTRRKRVPTKYAVYIQSEHWFKRRNRYWQEHPRRCAVCNTAQRLHLHHMLYNSSLYGREPDEHLIGLCEAHHDMYHAEYGTRSNMVSTTMQFVKENRTSPTVLDTSHHPSC